MKKIFLLLSIFLITLSLGTAQAAIINLNSRINSRSSPIELFLEAGTYTVETIGIARGGLFDAWSAWRFTNCADANGCQRTYPTTFTGFLTSYEVYSDYLSRAAVNGLDLVPTALALPLDNYFLVTPAVKLLFVESGLAYPDPLSALAGAQTTVFTLSDADTVGFSITDSPSMLGDNRGGLSLKIDPVSAIPEPSVIIVLGFGLLILTVFHRKLFK